MPKRSNEFQRLVHLVKQQLAPGSTVTESAMLKDLVSGEEREVDVAIETRVGGHDVRISIECRDHARRADVTWVEQMKAKHERLPTNALVLVSRRGFAASAAAKARSYNIEILSLDAVDEEAATRLLDLSSTLWSKSFSIAPTQIVAQVSAEEELPAECVALLQDNFVHRADGSEICNARELVTYLITSDQARNDFTRQGREEHREFLIEWSPPRFHGGEQLFLKKLDPERLRQIDCIRVSGTCDFKIEQFALHFGRLGDVHVAWGSTTLFDREAMFVAAQEVGDERKISVQVSGTPKRG